MACGAGPDGYSYSRNRTKPVGRRRLIDLPGESLSTRLDDQMLIRSNYNVKIFPGAGSPFINSPALLTPFV